MASRQRGQLTPTTDSTISHSCLLRTPYPTPRPPSSISTHLRRSQRAINSLPPARPSEPPSEPGAAVWNLWKGSLEFLDAELQSAASPALQHAWPLAVFNLPAGAPVLSPLATRDPPV
ncbi:unnamed protein product [Gadus morhua 'NCC']